MVKGPYLVRTATIKGNTLWLTGDLNETVSIEIIAPQGINNFRWHGEAIRSHTTRQGTITSSLLYKEPKISLPNLAKLHWVCFINGLRRAFNAMEDIIATISGLQTGYKY